MINKRQQDDKFIKEQGRKAKAKELKEIKSKLREKYFEGLEAKRQSVLRKLS